MSITVPINILTDNGTVENDIVTEPSWKAGLDIDKIASLKDAEELLAKLAIEEKKIEETLEWYISNRHQLEARLAQVSKLLPTLQAVQKDASRLEETIASTQQLASTVSARVRKLDAAKQNVVQVQTRVGDLLDLEGCAAGVSTSLQQEDYETAAAHIHRFLSMDETLLLSSAEHSSTKGARSIEVWFERLRAAKSELSALIERRLDEAVSAQDSASVDRFFKLFPLINMKQQGLAKFSAFLCAKVQEMGDACLKKCEEASSTGPRAHLLWADAATELFEAVANIIEVRQPMVETYYGAGQLVQLVTELLRETDRQAGRLIAGMKRHRRLDSLTAAVSDALSSSTAATAAAPGVPDLHALDALLAELTLLNSRSDLFLRFMRRRVVADLETFIVDADDLNKQVSQIEAKLWRSQVACDMAAVVGQYTLLEQFYLHCSFAKAVSLDTASDKGAPAITSTGEEASAAVSSLVDDAFFIIKKSVRRAIASSSCDGVCAVLNHAVTLLETQLAHRFVSTLKRGFPATGYLDIAQAYTVWQSSLQSSLQSGKLNTGSPDTEALRHDFLTALNSAETSQRHVAALESGLQDAVATAMTGLSPTSHDKIQSCFGDLRNCGVRLQSVVELGVSQLRATAVKPRVKTWMQTFTSTSHDITEEEFAGFEAHDPFSEALCVHVNGLLFSYRPLLTAANHQAFTVAVVEEVATGLEQAMHKITYNRLGGLLVDREVRAVVGLLSQAANYSVRGQLARLTQMATLLNLDHLHEVEEYSSSSTWQLTAAETRKTLQLRVDFKYKDIKRQKI